MFIENYTGLHNGHKVSQNTVLYRKLRCLRGLQIQENREQTGKKAYNTTLLTQDI